MVPNREASGPLMWRVDVAVDVGPDSCAQRQLRVSCCTTAVGPVGGGSGRWRRRLIRLGCGSAGWELEAVLAGPSTHSDHSAAPRGCWPNGLRPGDRRRRRPRAHPLPDPIAQRR